MLQSHMYLIKEILRGLNVETTQEVKDYSRHNDGEQERNLGMERHTLLRARGNEGKYAEEWPKRPQ